MNISLNLYDKLLFLSHFQQKFRLSQKNGCSLAALASSLVKPLPGELEPLWAIMVVLWLCLLAKIKMAKSLKTWGKHLKDQSPIVVSYYCYTFWNNQYKLLFCKSHSLSLSRRLSIRWVWLRKECDSSRIIQCYFFLVSLGFRACPLIFLTLSYCGQWMNNEEQVCCRQLRNTGNKIRLKTVVIAL